MTDPDSHRNPVQHDPAAIARKGHTLVLQKLQEHVQGDVADALGLTDCSLSRLKTAHLEEVIKLLALLGIKLVPAELKCYRPDLIEVIFQEYRQRMVEAKCADDVLRWDD